MAILYAFSFTLLLGFSALGTEGVYVLFKQRQLESAASASALAGATALMTGRPADYRLEARAVAATAGFQSGVAGVSLAINHPPLAGGYAGNAVAVEVVIAQPQTLPLSSMFYAGPWTISARAVASQGNSASDCVLALDSSAAGGISISNGVNIYLNTCGLGVNATGNASLSVVGGAVLNASSVTVSGSISTTNGGVINSASAVRTLQPPTADPYSAVAVPAAVGCKYNGLALGWSAGTQTLSADGVYCNGLSMGGGAVVAMNPGVYIINGGSFSIQGGARLTGTGVTIVLTGSGGNYATSSIANGATVTLSAPTTGATAGLVFLQNPAAPTTGSSSFQGGSAVTLTGALYFPTQTVVYANGTSSSSPCTQLVAWRIQFAGGASFNSHCATTGVGVIGASPTVLVE